MTNVERYRPKPLSRSHQDQIVGALKTGANEALAAEAMGLTERMLRHIKANYPEFRERCELARRIADGFVQRAMFKLATQEKNPNVAAQIFWMKNRCGWADRTQIAATLDIHVLPKIVEASMQPAIEERAIEMLVETGEGGEILALPPSKEVPDGANP